jgi:hypothetical protein
MSPVVFFYSGQAQTKPELIQDRGCVSSFERQHEFMEDQADHVEEHGISDREDHSNDPRHHRSTFFLGLQGLPSCLGLRLPAIVINLRRAATDDMQGCFALAIINNSRSSIADSKDSQQAR